jgi:hypothetical protein
MKKPLLFCSLIGILSGCYSEADISPDSSSLASKAVGLYRTNLYLDPSRVATPTDKMPYTELRAESDSTLTLTYTKFYPTPGSQSIPHVLVKQQSDGIQLQVAGLTIGTLKTDRIFTNNGMEKQGQLLRLTIPGDSANNLIFSGIQ